MQIRDKHYSKYFNISYLRIFGFVEWSQMGWDNWFEISFNNDKIMFICWKLGIQIRRKPCRFTR